MSNANELSILLEERFGSLCCSFSRLNFLFFDSEVSEVLLFCEPVLSSLYLAKAVFVKSAALNSGNSSCKLFLFLAYQLINVSFFGPSFASFVFDFKGIGVSAVNFCGFSGVISNPANPILH